MGPARQGREPMDDGGIQVPADWVQPLTIEGVAAHNWDFQNEARTAKFWLHHLEVTTDLSQVDPRHRRAQDLAPQRRRNRSEEAGQGAAQDAAGQRRLSTPAPSRTSSRAPRRLSRWPSATGSRANWPARSPCRFRTTPARPCCRTEQAVEVESVANLTLAAEGRALRPVHAVRPRWTLGRRRRRPARSPSPICRTAAN